MRLGLIDSQLLLDVCDGDRVADEVLFTLRVKGYLPTASQTTVQEIMDMALEDGDELARDALSILSRNRHHDKIYAPQIDHADYGCACMAAEVLLDRNLVADKNFSLVITEAASLQARVLVLADDELAALDQKAINAVLADRQLTTVSFQSWTELLKS